MRIAALSIFALSAMVSAETATLRVISNAAAARLVPVELQLATPTSWVVLSLWLMPVIGWWSRCPTTA